MHRDGLSHVRAGAISGGSWRKLQAARMGLTPMARSSAAKPRGRGSSGTSHGCHKGVFSSRWLLNVDTCSLRNRSPERGVEVHFRHFTWKPF